VPPDNPFIGGSGLSEIWAYGLRNPWRFSFDRITGDLFVADVGETSSLELQGVYFYGDYYSGRIWGAVSQDDGTWAVKNCSPLASTSPSLEKTRPESYTSRITTETRVHCTKW